MVTKSPKTYIADSGCQKPGNINYLSMSNYIVTHKSKIVIPDTPFCTSQQCNDHGQDLFQPSRIHSRTGSQPSQIQEEVSQ